MLSLLALAAPTVWRNYEEVFDLALDGRALLLATNGGLLRDGKPFPSPSGIRLIEGVRPLVVALADGRRLRQEGTRWATAGPTDRTQDLEHGRTIDGDWPLSCPPPPRAPYAALQTGAAILAGTADGLWRYEAGQWTRQNLPSPLPVVRPNGIAQQGEVFVVGGLGGLYVGRPGAWRKAADDAIRQVGVVGGAVWVVHGNGAVDKLDPAKDRLYPDILAGNARRPWSSCLGENGTAPIFGGLGGWTELPAAERYPKGLRGDVVTAIIAEGGVRWVGTQKAGLFRFEGAKVQRWNPGNGLMDTWVTALQRTPVGLVVGTARKGLFRLVDGRIKPLASPTPRVTALAFWHDRLVVGGMDGSWIFHGSKWKTLPTRGEETTGFARLGGRLAATTSAGVFFLTEPTSSPVRPRSARP